MPEPGGWSNPSNWISFSEAGAEIEKRFGCRPKKARGILRQAFIGEDLMPKKAPYEHGSDWFAFHPVSEWSSIAPSEWRRREVDYDDGEVMVMIFEKAFREWLARLEIGKPEGKHKRDGTPQASVRQLIPKLFPNGIASISNTDLVHRVGVELKARGQRVPERSTILRAADRK